MVKKNLTLLILSLAISCSRSPSKYYTDGKSSYDNGEYGMAIELFTLDIDIHGGSDLAYYYRGKAKQFLGDYRSAISDFDRSIDINYELIFCHVDRAVSHIRLKENDIALQRLNETIEYFKPSQDSTIAKNLAVAYNNRGLIKQFRLKDYEGAMADYDTSFNLGDFPQTYLTLMNRGRLFLVQKKFHKALTDLDKSIKANSKKALTYYIRGQVYYQTDKFEKAIEDSDRAIELGSPEWGFFNLRGRANTKLENYPESISDFNKAIEITNHPYAYNNRGFSKYKIGNLKEALQECKKSLELDDENSWVYYNLGLINYDLGNKQDACEHFEKALDLGKEEARLEIQEKC